MSTLFRKAVAGFSAVAMVASMFVIPFTASAATPGEVYKMTDGTVVFITSDMQKRPFTSFGAFQSYGFLSASQIKDATADVMALPTGAFVPPQDGKLICSDRGADKGTCYLITGGQKAGFTSASVFTGLGFSFSRSLSGDVSFLPSTSNIDNTSMAHRPGVLVNNNGTVQLVGTSSLLGIPSVDVFNSFGYSFADVVPANGADKQIPQAGVMLARVAGQLSPVGTTSPAPTGAISVNLSSNTPVSATVPRGATGVVYTRFNIVNGSSNSVNVTGLTVQRTGSGSPSDFNNVYLYNGAVRVTTGRTINTSSNQATFNALSIAIPAMGTVTLDLVADMTTSAGSGNVHQLSVQGVTVDNGTVSGSATGNPMTMASALAGSIVVKKSGTFSNPKVGQTGAQIGEFRLEAGSAEDLMVKRITLYQGGNINRAALMNVKLMQGGTQVGTGMMDAAGVRIVFDNMNILQARGQSRTYQVFADIGGAARANDQIKLYLEENTDVLAIGQVFGFGATVDRSSSGTYDGSSCTSTSGNCSFVQLDGGRVTLNFQGPPTTDVSPNGQNVELFRYTMNSQNNIEVRRTSLQIAVTGTSPVGLIDSGAAMYKNIKITDTDTNQTVAGPMDVSTSGSDSSQTLLFTDVYNLSAGQTRKFKVTADLAQFTPASDEKVRIDVNTFGSNDIRNLDNSNFLSPSADIVPSTTLTGNSHNVRNSNLTVSVAGTPAAQSYVSGRANTTVAGYNFIAGIGRDVKVNSVKVTAAGGTNECATVANCVLGLRLMDGATQLGQTQTLSSGTATFNNLNYTIPRGSTKTLMLVTDLANITISSTAAFRFDISSTSDVTAQDPDGNVITPSGTATGPVMTLSQGGSLTVLNAGTEVDVTDNHIVVAGKTNQTTAKFRFTATKEAVRVTQLGISVGSGAIEEVTAIRLFDGATELVPGGVVPDSSGVARFVAASGGQLFTIAKDGSKVITVSVDLNLVRGTGAASGTQIATTLVADGTATFEAIGADSGRTLTDPTLALSPTGTMTLRNTKPTIELVPLTDRVLTTGTKTVFRFKVTADANEQLSLKKLSFSLNAYTSAFTADTLRIRRAGTVTNLATTSVATLPANGGAASFSFNSEEVIAAGTSITYELLATIATAPSATQSIATAFTNTDAAVETGALGGTLGAITVGGNARDFIWSDFAIAAHSDALSGGSADFTNGYLVRTPTDSQSLVPSN